MSLISQNLFFLFIEVSS